nr:MAG TPA: minor tail protein [Caudoviricetes sp.]
MVSRRNPKVTDLNNFAISSDGIATALQDSASSLMAAGNNLEQSVAMIAAANKVLQDPNSVGSALRTISLRIRGTSVKVLEEMGEETDGVIESVSKLQAKVKGLSGVDILTDTGAYKDTYTIIKEIGQVWADMNDIDKAALLELLAGKNRSNAMAALLTNMEDLEGAYEDAMEAQGSAEAENEKYMNSIQGKVDQFTNALQTMWSNWISSGIVKWVVDFVTALVKLADALGLVGTAAAALGAKFAISKIFSSIKSSITAVKDAYSVARGVVSTISSFSGEGLASFLGGKVETAKITEITHALGAEIMTQKELNKELAKNILLKNGVKAEDIDGALAAMGFTGANTSLAFSFDGLGVAIKKAAIAFWASPFGKFAIIAAGITIFAIAMNALIKTHQDYVKELKETSDEISDVKSNLSSLEDELKSVSDRINELNSKDKLSFTEKEELKNLKAQNAELERSIRIEEQKEKRLQKKAAKNLNDAVKTDFSINGESTVYKDSDGHYVSRTAAVDQNVDRYAPGNEKLNDGYSKETVSSIQAKIIEYERTQKELDEAKDELENLGDEAEDKEVKNAQAKVDRLQRSVDNAYNAISNTMDKFNEDYLSQDGVEWQYGNPNELEDWQKQMNANLKIIYDAQDKLAIGSDKTGKAIKSAFSRVTLQTEFQDELEEIQNEAGITGEKLKEMYEADNSTDNTGMKALIQSLMDCGVIANTSAEELQKVVDLSLELGDSSSDAAVANRKLARSQKMLQYYKQYKELGNYTKKLKEAKGATNTLSNEDKKSISLIRQKMQSLAEEISKYDILGDQMNEAKEAFTNFENAKKAAEENTDYIGTAGEMLQALVDGFHSAEMGSETFKSAFKGLIPESVYEDLDTLEERYTAAGEYIKGTLSRYFKIEYDDDGAIKSVEATTKNIETFIEDAKEKGLMSFSDGIWTVEETDFKKFADKMGITESMLVAIGKQMDNIDADWIMGDNSSFFDSFDMGTEANIYKATKALADLDQQFIDGKVSVDEYTQKYQELQDKLSENKENAINDIINYDNATKKVDELQNSLKAATDKLNELKNNPDATEDQISEAAKNANEIATNLQTALQNKAALEKPSQVLVEFAVANIEDEKAKIVAELGTIDASIKLTTTDKDGKEQINSDIIKQLDDGTYTINVDANISEESKAKVQSYVDLLNKEAQINSYVEGDQGAKESADDLKKTYEDLSQVIKDLPSPKINTSLAQSAVNTLKKTVDNLKDSFDDLPTEVTTTITTVNRTVNETVERKSTGFKWIDKILGIGGLNGNAHFDGAANASGTLGAEKTETSLVGELGPELRVRGNHWEMLGENGAEFADVQKGDIIFNHKQTEELLKNGHISSRGKAFVGGTAYAGTSGTIFTRYATEKDYGGKVPDWYGHADLLYDAADSVSDAADDISDAADDFEEVFDWFEVLLEEIEDNISLMNAKLENAVGISAKKGIYSEIINTEQFKLQELYEGIKLYSDYANKLLAKVPDQYKEMAKNGAVAITDFLGEANEEVVESINNYREWAKKVTDLNQQLEETKKAIADTHVEIQNMLKDEYDNRISLITSVNDRIQDTIDLLDEEGKRSSAVMYEEMIKNSTKQLSELQNKRAEMQRALDEAVSLGPDKGIEKYSTQWYEMVNAINDVDSEINDCRIDLEGFQNSINQLHWDNFEKFIDAIDNVGNEISNLGDLIDEEDIVDEVGNWTDKGVTALGLYAQEMERAKYRAEQYGKEIEYLNQEYAAGKYSEDEYLEKLQELKDGQWDSIKSYESAKKSIIDLNKTRIEAVKDGIQKEIDAYSELIDKKKEELSLQKDAHDFQKQVTEKQKEIADIQKKLAVMSGDNSASAIAQKKKLQAELAAAQEELDEIYYDHSVEKQQEALDKSLENYQDEKDTEMEKLDESLKNEEQIIADSYATIAANTESIAQTLSDIASQYGITLSDSVTKPWLDGANAIGTYQEQLDTSMSSFTQQLETLKKMYSDLQSQADSAGKSMIDAINSNKSKTESSAYTPPAPSQPSTPSTPSAPYNGATVTVKRSATHFSRDGGNGTRMQSWVPGSDFTVYQVSGSDVLIGRNGGYTGWVKLSDLEGYASGTKGVSKDQLAMLDELGDELVLHAGKNGRLEFLTKGTSVIPSDITENLMKLGSLDPRQVLDNNRPSIGAPHIVNNSMEINMQIAEVVHIDHADNSSIPDITKAVQNQIDAYMSKVNSSLRRYTR